MIYYRYVSPTHIIFMYRVVFILIRLVLCVNQFFETTLTATFKVELFLQQVAAFVKAHRRTVSDSVSLLIDVVNGDRFSGDDGSCGNDAESHRAWLPLHEFLHRVGIAIMEQEGQLVVKK